MCRKSDLVPPTVRSATFCWLSSNDALVGIQILERQLTLIRRIREWFTRPQRKNLLPTQTNDEGKSSSVFSADEPILSASEDRLGRAGFVRRVVDTIVGRHERAGLVVGVFGEWGEGKTSLMRMIEAQLGGRDDLVTFWFNPWFFKSEEHLIEMFFHSLAAAIGKNLGNAGERLGKLLRQYGAFLEWLPEIGDKLSHSAHALGKELTSTTLDDLRKRVNKCLDEAGKRVVIFVDDVDRLDRTEIQTVVKLVKLTAGFDFVTYVLAFDDQIVSRALGERYAERSTESGQGFLEKIIQLPLRLPTADPTVLLSLTLESTNRVLQASDVALTEEQIREFRRYFDDAFSARVRTPRAGKRYSNALAFALPVLRGEVNPVDLMLMEAIRAFYPDVYSNIRPSRDLFLGRRATHGPGAEQEANRQRWSKIIGGLTASEARAIQDALTYLFPRLKSTTANFEFGSDWDEKWDKEQRIASASYFDRYFQLGIPFDDVSDVELGQLHHLLNAGATDQAESEFRRLGQSHSVDRLLTKLRADEKSFPRVAARTLIGVLARTGETLPEREQAFASFTAPVPQAAILMKHLMKTLREQERQDVAIAVVKNAQPLAFALECYSWVKGSDEERKGGSAVLSVESEQLLESTLLRRIKEQTTSSFLLDLPPSQARAVLNAWAGFADKGETEAYLKKMFDAGPGYAARFVTFFLPSAWDMETGLPVNAPLSRSGYDAIARLIDPKLVLAALRNVYGAELDKPQYMEGLVSKSREQAAAHQFAYIHSQATQSSGEQDSKH